ncbi:hypothetical protein MESS4_240056 [Mesorhizobium sp. STM 4661]|nr:hypothetical protein MESS4_240056 [Mesorhizobium sp. STM 4661]
MTPVTLKSLSWAASRALYQAKIAAKAMNPPTSTETASNASASAARIPPSRPDMPNVRIPAVRLRSGASRSRQPRSNPTSRPIASASPSRAMSESMSGGPSGGGHRQMVANPPDDLPRCARFGCRSFMGQRHHLAGAAPGCPDIDDGEAAARDLMIENPGVHVRMAREQLAAALRVPGIACRRQAIASAATAANHLIFLCHGHSPIDIIIYVRWRRPSPCRVRIAVGE